MFSVQVLTLSLDWHHLKLPLYPLCIGEIVGIAVASFFAVLFLILLIVSIVYAVHLYNKKEVNLKVNTEVSLNYLISIYICASWCKGRLLLYPIAQ